VSLSVIGLSYFDGVEYPSLKLGVLHFHTFFLFPFSIDQSAVMAEHPEIWPEASPWFEKLDEWVAAHVVPGYEPAASIGRMAEVPGGICRFPFTNLIRT
jgi:hypothetical protein